MALFNTKRAFFFDARKEQHGKKGFKKHQKIIKYGTGAYNIDLRASYWEDNPLPILWKRRTYYYNTEHSNPLFLGTEAAPIISPELYNINLKAEAAKKLNDLAKKTIFDFINPKVMILIGLLIVAIIYLTRSGTIKI